MPSGSSSAALPRCLDCPSHEGDGALFEVNDLGFLGVWSFFESFKAGFPQILHSFGCVGSFLHDVLEAVKRFVLRKPVGSV